MIAQNPKIHLDLTTLLGKLGRETEEKKIGGLIRKCLAASVVLSDITRAKQALVLLMDLDADQAPTSTLRKQDEIDGVLGQSLFTLAVMLYARATQTETKHRSKVPVTNAYDAKLREAHRRAMAIRNNAIAHYGPGEGGDLSRPWSDDRAVLELSEHSQEFYYPTVRANYLGSRANELGALIDAAHTFCLNYIREAEAEAFVALRDRSAALPEFRERLFAGRFDPEAFFEGSRAAADTTSGISRPTTVWRSTTPS